MPCGTSFLAGLGCVGLCLARLGSHSFVGGRGVARGVLWFGRWFLCVNARCFEDTSQSFEEILHYFLFTLYTWAAGWIVPLVISFQDFLSRFSSPS